jgi:hypothetical protein
VGAAAGGDRGALRAGLVLVSEPEIGRKKAQKAQKKQDYSAVGGVAS